MEFTKGWKGESFLVRIDALLIREHSEDGKLKIESSEEYKVKKVIYAVSTEIKSVFLFGNIH